MNLITAYNEHCCGHDWPSQTIVATLCYIGTVRVANALFARSRLTRILAKAGYSVLDSTDDFMIKQLPSHGPELAQDSVYDSDKTPIKWELLGVLVGKKQVWEFLVVLLFTLGWDVLFANMCPRDHALHLLQKWEILLHFHAILIYLVSNLVNADYEQQISRCQRYAIMH